MAFYKRFFLLVLLISISLSNVSYGQDSLANKASKLDFLNDIDQRKWHAKVPIWVPGFRGSFAYGGISQLPESGDNSIIDRLNGELGVTFYLIGDISYRPKNWLFNVDGFHTTLASNLKFENIDKVQFNVDLEGTILRGLAGYKVYEKSNKDSYFNFKIYPYIGLRYINLDIYSENTAFLNIRPDWFELLVGLRVPIQYKRWFFATKADIGGFGINNHMSWYVNGEASYRFSKLFAMGLGYSVIDINYDGEFEYNQLNLGIRLAGPVLNLEFHF